ncbi:MAG: ArsA family ATPase [Deltaproteobacteria bacterium]|nr:ArsA family ATPase [Deltaproteobacteria bacterium]
MSHWLSRLLERQQVLVTLGNGGVGKTTLAAALALQGALRGRRTLVLTIDPARRLAGALGLEEFTAERQRVPLEGLVPATAGQPGELWVMMLDAPRTFAALVARHASNDEARERIFGHRLYRHMVDALAGSHDLAALEKLHELLEEHRYDLIVLDTPPKEHAFDFLDAPSRLLALVAQSRLHWLLLPMAGFGLQQVGGLRSLPTRLILRSLSRFTGQGVLQDLATLTLALLDLSTGFKERAARVEQLLASQGCSFLVVTIPDPFTAADALDQRQKLLDSGLPFAGFLVNRCQRIPSHAPDEGEDMEQLAEQLSSQDEVAGLLPLVRLRPMLLRLGHGLALLRDIARQERETIARLRGQGAASSPLLEIPELDEEIHSVRQLLRFGGLLVEG